MEEYVCTAVVTDADGREYKAYCYCAIVAADHPIAVTRKAGGRRWEFDGGRDLTTDDEVIFRDRDGNRFRRNGDG